MKILIVDEWGGFNSIRLAADLAHLDVEVFILREFDFHVSMPRNAILLPPVSLALADRLEALQNAVEVVRPDAILPMDESTLILIWSSSPTWLDKVQPQVSPDFHELYGDKHRMEAFASSLALPVPETLYLQKMAAEGSLDCEDLRSHLEPFGLPVVIKGAGGCRGEQVRIAETIEQAECAIRELHDNSGQLPAIQQYIDGVPVQVGGLFDRGRPVHFLAGEKIAIHPPRTGPAVALKSIVSSDLMKYSSKLLTKLEFSGLAGLDFVQDRHGHYYFLEINPRIWGSYGFVPALGIDMFKSWCQQLEGDTLPTSTDYPAGKTWAKMPEYVLSNAHSNANLIKRMCQPIAIKSLSWSRPSLLLYQFRRLIWALRK